MNDEINSTKKAVLSLLPFYLQMPENEVLVNLNI